MKQIDLRWLTSRPFTGETDQHALALVGGVPVATVTVHKFSHEDRITYSVTPLRRATPNYYCPRRPSITGMSTSSWQRAFEYVRGMATSSRVAA